ncbi:uncharacterized protein N7506_011812 [Penicillium brevicompactum]|uniref:uncharacterized protein n=1 Tax=Penicillium brevicompactum TaxID=5074 RepID=UPI0025410751|nr:uncharacterized protein N7506_011812 [Penicillium brevicompactum]KAJ5319108.1 hypothetical protein N7506_011812 [Penicillium brevicompactum]
MAPPTSKPSVNGVEFPPEPTVGPSLTNALHPRDLAIKEVDGFSYMGCFANNATVIAGYHEEFSRLNPDYCCNVCKNRSTNNTWCGLGNGNYCFCDSTTVANPSSLPDSSCSSTCYGDVNYACGGAGAVGLYSATTEFVPTKTAIVSKTLELEGYSNYGCFTDSSDHRVLSAKQQVFQMNDPEWCCSFCAGAGGGYRWCGVENGHNCYCASSTSSGALEAPASECKVGCYGKPNVQCGARLRINLYSATGSLPETVSAVSTTQADQESTTVAISGNSSGSGSGLSGGAIAGIAIGAVAGVVSAGLAFWFLCRSRRKSDFDIK